MSTSTPISLEQRIRGAIYGALVGDALGVPVEFKARSYLDANPVTGMRGWGMWHQRPGTWSDDGSLLLCTVEGVTDAFSLEKIGALYVQWMQSGYWSARDEVFDIGGATNTALDRLRTGVPPDASGCTGDQHNGNGALMRILPIGLRYARRDRDRLVPRAMAVSAITHAHPRSQLACALYSVIAAELLDDTPLREAVRRASNATRNAFQQTPDEQGWFARTFDGRLFELPRGELNSTGYVIDTFESALWCLDQYRSFESAVLAAVNLGGDTDTTGCVTGGLAGLIYGSESIPQVWLEALPKRDAIDALMVRFIKSCTAT